MYSEYSVAYSYQTPADIEAFTQDFMPFLQRLEQDAYYQYAINQLSSEFLDAIGKRDLKNTTALPDNWRKLLKAMLNAIHSGELTLYEIDSNFAQRFEKLAYEASYLQALYVLMTY